jgi:DNA-dependent RNA polymerase auxiliary subunit epsilon
MTTMIVIGKMNDKEETGKSCFLIGDSVQKIRKFAREHEVYEITYASEISDPVLITYTDIGVRAWPKEVLQDLFDGEWYAP